MSNPQNYFFRLTFWSILAITLLLRLWDIEGSLPVVVNVDESFAVSTAVRLGNGDLNPHIFMWPHLFFYMLFSLYGLFYSVGTMLGFFSSLTEFKNLYFNDPSAFYLIGRLFSAAMATACVALLYHFGKLFRSRVVGLVAAGFLAVSVPHIEYSRVALPEMTMCFLVLLAAWFAFRLLKTGHWRDYMLAGIAGGLAVSAKYNAYLIFPTITLAHFMRMWQREPGQFFREWHKLVFAGASALAAFFATTPYALLDYQTFWRDIAFTSLVSSPDVVSGTWFSAAKYYLVELFFHNEWLTDFNLTGIFICVGVLWLAWQRQHMGWLLLSYPLLHFVFFAAKTIGDPRLRYMLPIVPFLCLVGAVLIIQTAGFGFAKWRRKRTVSQPCIVMTALLLCVPAFVGIAHFRWLNEKDTASAAREWILDNLPADTRILYSDYHTLALKRNQPSLEAYYRDIRGDAGSQKVLQLKIAALNCDATPAYEINELYHGWTDENREHAQNANYLPQGVLPIDESKFSVSYWRQRGFVHVVVFRDAIERYLSGPEGEQFPKLQAFYRDLLKNADLVVEFQPIPPRLTGYHIQILKLSEHKNIFVQGAAGS